MKILFFILMLGAVCANAAPDFNKLADAIYKAEGGAKTRHPYGILTKYRKTTPRQACINTCKHAWKDYKGPESGFVDFLADRYCPQSADYQGNVNWKKNVKKFLNLSE